MARVTGAPATPWHMGGRRALHTFIWPAAGCRRRSLSTHASLGQRATRHLLLCSPSKHTIPQRYHSSPNILWAT